MKGSSETNRNQRLTKLSVCPLHPIRSFEFSSSSDYNRRETKGAEVESRVYAAEIPLVSQKPMKIHLEEEQVASVSLSGCQAKISIESRVCNDLFVHRQSCTSAIKVLAVQISNLSSIRTGIITLATERETLFGAFVF